MDLPEKPESWIQFVDCFVFSYLDYHSHHFCTIPDLARFDIKLQYYHLFQVYLLAHALLSFGNNQWLPWTSSKDERNHVKADS